MKINDIAFKLILYSGNARSKIMTALKHARDNHSERALQMLTEADKELEKAHKVQTEVLQKEARGERIDTSILFIHAQDHLMTAMLARELSEEIVSLRKISS